MAVSSSLDLAEMPIPEVQEPSDSPPLRKEHGELRLRGCTEITAGFILSTALPQKCSREV